jgi:hypothetical protein
MKTWFVRRGEVGSVLRELVWVLSGQEEERKTDWGKRGRVVVYWCCYQARLVSGLSGGEAGEDRGRVSEGKRESAIIEAIWGAGLVNGDM